MRVGPPLELVIKASEDNAAGFRPVQQERNQRLHFASRPEPADCRRNHGFGHFLAGLEPFLNVQEIVGPTLDEERVVMTLVNEATDKRGFELRRSSEAMQRGFTKHGDALAAQFMLNQIGVRNCRCFTSGWARSTPE